MKSNRCYAFFGLLFPLLLVAACVRAPAPSLKPVLLNVDLQPLRDRTAHWGDYTARFRMRIENPAGNTRSGALVIFKGPQPARFESYTPFGQTVALFVRNESESSVLIPSQKAIFVSKRPEALIAHFLGIDLPLDVFRYSLVGCVPPELVADLQVFDEGAVWKASSRSSGQDRSFVWEFTPGFASLKAAAVTDRRGRYRVEYDPPVPIAVDSTPQRIVFASPEWRMEIDLEQIRPDPEVSQEIFRLPPVSGARVTSLDQE